jgi:hypothetical protein
MGAGSPHCLANDRCQTAAAIQENQRPAVRLSQNVMAVNPDSLTAAPCPMSRPPDVIGAADVITSTASVIRPIANLHRDGARVSGISWAVARAIGAITSVIWSVSWITTIIPFTSRCTEGDRNQNQHECGPFRFRFCSTFCGNCFRLPMINNVRFHTLIIRIRNSFHAPVSIETAKAFDRKLATRRLGRASRRRLSRSRQCSRRLRDYLAGRTQRQCPTRFCGW